MWYFASNNFQHGGSGSTLWTPIMYGIMMFMNIDSITHLFDIFPFNVSKLSIVSCLMLVQRSTNSYSFTFLDDICLGVFSYRPFQRTITMHKDSSGHVGFIFKSGRITSLVKDGSAARNGLLTDHYICEINGQNVIGLKVTGQEFH